MTATPETPSITELTSIYDDAEFSLHAVYNAGFTRGEQRGLERAVVELKNHAACCFGAELAAIADAIDRIESLRAASNPPVEPSGDSGEVAREEPAENLLEAVYALMESEPNPRAAFAKILVRLGPWKKSRDARGGK